MIEVPLGQHLSLMLSLSGLLVEHPCMHNLSLIQNAYLNGLESLRNYADRCGVKVMSSLH